MITRTTPNVLIYKYCVYYIIIASPSGRLYQCCKRIIVSDVVIVVVVVPYNILNKCLYIIRPFLNALDLSNFIELVLLPPSPPHHCYYVLNGLRILCVRYVIFWYLFYKFNARCFVVLLNSRRKNILYDTNKLKTPRIARV